MYATMVLLVTDSQFYHDSCKLLQQVMFDIVLIIVITCMSGNSIVVERLTCCFGAFGSRSCTRSWLPAPPRARAVHTGQGWVGVTPQ